MAGQAEPAGVGATLSVAEDGLRRCAEPAQRREKDRDFSEGEKPRHVQEGRWAAGGGDLDDLARLEIVDDRRGDQIPAKRGHIATGNMPQSRPVEGALSDPVAKERLGRDRLPGREVPPMERPCAHGAILRGIRQRIKDPRMCYSSKLLLPIIDECRGIRGVPWEDTCRPSGHSG